MGTHLYMCVYTSTPMPSGVWYPVSGAWQRCLSSSPYLIYAPKPKIIKMSVIKIWIQSSSNSNKYTSFWSILQPHLKSQFSCIRIFFFYSLCMKTYFSTHFCSGQWAECNVLPIWIILYICLTLNSSYMVGKLWNVRCGVGSIFLNCQPCALKFSENFTPNL